MSVCIRLKPKLSYFELEILPGGVISIFERMGDGVTEELVRALAELGLKLETRVSSPCG